MTISKEEIQESIKKSRAKYTARKQIQDQIITKRQEGIAYIHEKEIPVKPYKIGNLNIFLALEPLSSEFNYKLSWTIVSSKDTPSLRIAKGLLGNRLKYKNQRFYFPIILPYTNFMDKFNYAFLWFKFMVYQQADMFPKKLLKELLKELK